MTPSPPHIVYVEQGFPRAGWAGGAGTYVHLVGRALAQQGCAVSVIALSGPHEPRLETRDGMSIYRPVATGRLHWYLAKLPGLRRLALAVRALEHGRIIARALDDLHRRQPVDLVEFTEGGDFWHRARAPFPYVCHLHGSAYTFKRLSGRVVGVGDWWQRRLELDMIARAAWVVSPSHTMLGAAETEHGRSFGRSRVIPYPLDPRLLADQAPEAPAEDSCRILFAARNDAVKGGDVLVEAAQQIARTCPHVQFGLYGYEPTHAERASISAAALDDRICFHPFVTKETLLRHYAAADICVVPSRWDNSPNTVYEAMAAGKPVVASRVGGIPELVQDEVTGILVPPDDATALATALQRLAGDADLRARLGAAGRARIREIADLERNVAERRSIYDQVIAESRAAHAYTPAPCTCTAEESG
ncbi:MAG TPA: glycosyltransferase family 4 protein [Chloroflexia bacterium]|nr:glycosyltransferase family 4 protein [Chloroflexia bacterium]